jgi:hypothetical protein
MMKKTIIFPIFLLIHAIAADAVASCGSASCPLNNHRYLKSGWLQLGLTHEYINQDQVFVGSDKAFVGAIMRHHDEVQTLNERTVLDLQYGISDGIGLNLYVPFVHREHSHIHHHQGEDLWESWNFSGLGDLIVTGQYAFLTPSEPFGAYLSLTLGVKLPSGITDAKNVEGEEAEVTIQPGTGSLDGIVGLNYRQTLFSVPTLSGAYSALPLAIGVSYQFNGKGTYDYRFGNSLLTSVGTAYQFADRATLLFQANGRFQGFADVGMTGEPREDTGGTWIFASPGLSVQLSEPFSAYGYVQLPVYQNVHGIQQTAKVNLLFGISYNLDLLML